MSNDLIQVRVPHELKRQAEAIFASMGLKTGDAVRVFFQQSVNQNGLPFQSIAKIPNSQTVSAMQETDNGITEKISLSDLRKNMRLPPQ